MNDPYGTPYERIEPLDNKVLVLPRHFYSRPCSPRTYIIPGTFPSTIKTLLRVRIRIRGERRERNGSLERENKKASGAIYILNVEARNPKVWTLGRLEVVAASTSFPSQRVTELSHFWTVGHTVSVPDVTSLRTAVMSVFSSSACLSIRPSASASVSASVTVPVFPCTRLSVYPSRTPSTPTELTPAKTISSFYDFCSRMESQILMPCQSRVRS